MGGQVPRLRDSTLIRKEDIMIHIDCYHAEIRIVQTKTQPPFPRIVLIDENDREHTTFIDLDTDVKFRTLWSKLKEISEEIAK